MNDIQIFRHDEFGEIRTIEIDGATWFCGYDVAAALGYKKPRNAIAKHCKERGALKWGVPHPQSPDKQLEMTFINEPNVYRLITHSKLEGANRFENWVFEEVLPIIRKTGGYGQQKCIDCRIFEKLDYMNANINSLRTEIKERFDETLNDRKERLKPFLLDYIQEITQKSKGKDQYVCPLCNSGTGHNGTGAFTYYPDSYTYKCFACGEYGDIFTLHAQMNNLSSTSDFVQIVDELEKNSILCLILHALQASLNRGCNSVPMYTKALTVIT